MLVRGTSLLPVRRIIVSLTCLAMAWGTALLVAEEANDPPAASDEPVPVQEKQEALKKFRNAAIIRFEGPITPWLHAYFERKLSAAIKDGADLIILEIDSPGGLLTESSAIAQRLNELPGAHTVAYIPREALSGAALVSLGCDEIILRPSARIGDVGIIRFDKELGVFQHVEEKVRSPLITEIRGLANEHGRPAALAESMVDMDAEVFRFTNQRTNAKGLFTEKEIAAMADAADWQKQELILESKKGNFLTLTGSRALELGLADANVADLAELQARYEVTGRWKNYRFDNVDKTVYILNLWYVTGLLFIIGLVGILYECMAPGTYIGGLFGLLCFSLFFWSRFLGGTSGWLEVVLFLVGIAFLAVELLVLPGFGIAGVMGIGLIGVSIILACQTFVVPATVYDLQTTTGAVGTLVLSSVIFLVIAYFMTTYLGRIPILSQLVLTPAPAQSGGEESEVEDSRIPPEKKIPVGAYGETMTILRPGGRAMIDGEPVDVVSTGDVIAAGVKVRVVEATYGRIIVEEAE
jgi:membrane-bound serine protease (ClpP class)